MTYQLTVLNPNNSFVEAFFISDCLYQELSRISQIFSLKRLNLAFLREIRQRAITFCSCQIKTAEPLVVSAFASVALDWFDELEALITALESFASADTLSIVFC